MEGFGNGQKSIVGGWSLVVRTELYNVCVGLGSLGVVESTADTSRLLAGRSVQQLTGPIDGEISCHTVIEIVTVLVPVRMYKQVPTDDSTLQHGPIWSGLILVTNMVRSSSYLPT